jgi:hypothetical protein
LVEFLSHGAIGATLNTRKLKHSLKSWAISTTVSDDFVPLALSGQGEDQTRQQQFRPAWPKGWGREKEKQEQEKKNKPLGF